MKGEGRKYGFPTKNKIPGGGLTGVVREAGSAIAAAAVTTAVVLVPIVVGLITSQRRLGLWQHAQARQLNPRGGPGVKVTHAAYRVVVVAVVVAEHARVTVHVDLLSAWGAVRDLFYTRLRK
jgi:hypothetical protein